jgi:uncharacterized protein (DUF885 family)
MTEFSKLVDEFLEFAWQNSPVNATFTGIHKYDAELGKCDKNYLVELNNKTKEYLSRFDLLPVDILTESERLDHTLLTNSLKSGIKEFEEIRDWERNPTGYAQLCLYGVFILAIREFAPLLVRAQSMLSRLEKIPKALAEGKANLKNSPKIFTEIAIEITQAGIEFFQGYIPVFAETVPVLKDQILQANEKALRNFRDYLNFLTGEHLARSQGEFAIGKEHFDFKLKFDHLLPYNSDDLLEIGMRVFDETKRSLQETARTIDSTREWWEIVAELKNAHPAPAAIIAAYQKEIERTRRFTVDKGFVTMPPGEELAVIPTPVFERSTIPYAAYMPPAPFEKEQKGLFYVTPVDETATPEKQAEQLQGHSLYKIPVTVLHEGYPGHHLQLVHSNQVDSKIRKVYATSVFAEGWALYCEELMFELGYYADPKIRLTQLKDQLWRACRVIIDVKLHTNKLTFDEAVDFLVNEARLERVNAVAEVKRYTMTPTQPMSYIIGKLQILDLRKKIGSTLSQKDFHDRLLSFGTIPLSLIEEELLKCSQDK